MKISLIIPALNAASTLPKALESIWAQSYKDFEILVMDGGSNDGTREWLEAHQGRIGHWQSQKDRGTTDALNQGLTRSSGELISFLCADDRFHSPEVFARAVREFREHPDSDVLCTSLRMIDSTGLIPPYINPSNAQEMRRRGSLHLPGAFFRRKVFKERGLSPEAEVSNDYELMAYLTTRTPYKIRVCDMISLDFSLGGRTNNPKTDFRKIRECYYIRREYFGLANAWRWYLWDMSIAILRNLNIRPYTWVRKLARWTKGAHAN